MSQHDDTERQTSRREFLRGISSLSLAGAGLTSVYADASATKATIDERQQQRNLQNAANPDRLTGQDLKDMAACQARALATTAGMGLLGSHMDRAAKRDESHTASLDRQKEAARHDAPSPSR